ncbi:MAG: hypothetical protein ACYS8X_00330 [Planctomycetota bacterium]|jgi:Ca2+-binding RTX toxin-like protein
MFSGQKQGESISSYNHDLSLWAQRWQGLQKLEERLLLSTYFPGGDGVIGTLNVADLVLGSDDRVVIDIDAAAPANDDVQVSNSLTLNGILDVQLSNPGSLVAGDVFTPFGYSGATVDGQFLALDGLAATAGLDFVAIQGPDSLTLVATDLPTGDFTILVDEAAEVTSLISFFSAGTSDGVDDSVSITGSIFAMGQEIFGGLAFTEANDGSNYLSVGLDDTGLVGEESRVTVNSGGFQLIDVFGDGIFEVRDRADTTSGGLRLASTFTATGFTLMPQIGGSGTPSTNGVSAEMGPLKLDTLTAALSGLVFYDQSVEVGVGFSAAEISFNFSPDASDGTGDANAGNIIAKTTAATGTYGLAASYDGTSISGLGLSGAFSWSAGTFELEIPDVVTATATGISLSFDPDADISQEIFHVDSLTADLPTFNLSFAATPTDANPALSIRGDGFAFGSLTGTLTTTVEIGTLASITNPFLNISDFEITFGDAFAFNGSLGVGAASFRLGPQTGDFYATGTGLSTTLTFTNNVPDGIIFEAGSLNFQLGTYISASATDIVFNPTAAAGEVFLDVAGELSGGLDLSSLLGEAGLTMSGSVGVFSIMGDGTFLPGAGFNVSFSVNATNLGSLLGGVEFPSFLPIPGDVGGDITIAWPDFNASPERFIIALSLSLSGTVGPITLGGSISNLAIDTGKLLDGKFPILGVETVSVNAAADPIFGGSLAGGLIMGTVMFDDLGQRLPGDAFLTNPEDIDESIIYVGIKGEMTIANRGGFQLMFGLSELGPLMGYISIEVPIMLNPHTGLTLGRLAGGITFNATPFPDITDPADLRSPIFKSSGELTFEEWVKSLQQLVVNQMGGNPGYMFTIDPTDHSGTVGAWQTELALGDVPDALRDELLAYGHALSTTAGEVVVTALDNDDVWLLNNRGTEFVIELDSGEFEVGSIGFSLVDSFISDLDSAATVAGVTGLADAFEVAGVVLAASATVTVDVAGEEWTIDDAGVIYKLMAKGDGGDGVVRLAVTGGGGSLASLDQVVKLEAGVTIYSQYVADFMQVKGDLIMTTDGNFLVAGEMEFAGGAITMNTKMYFNLSELNAGTAQVLFLGDMPADPTIFSVYGRMRFGFIDDDDGDGIGVIIDDPNDFYEADAFQLELAGSETEGIAVFDLLGFQTFRLGGEADPGGGLTQYGQATLTFFTDRIMFAFNANLSAEGLVSAASFVSAAGLFTLDFSEDFDLWGVARLTATTEDIYPLTVMGVSGELDAILKINISDDARDMLLELPGEAPVSYHMERLSFGIYIFGSLTFDFIVFDQEFVGAFALEGSLDEGFELFMIGSMPLPLGAAMGVPLPSPVAMDVLGLVIIPMEFGIPQGFAARFEAVVRDDDLPAVLLDFEVDLQGFMNTTGVEQVFEIPVEFADKLEEALPPDLAARLAASAGEVTISAGAPQLDGSEGAVGPYMVFQGAGNLTFVDTFILTGDFHLEASVDGLFLQLGASMVLGPLGTVTASGDVELTENGLLGSLQLAGNLDLGIMSFFGSAALEFNTAGYAREIDRYYNVATKTVIPLDGTPETVLIDPYTLQIFIGGEMRFLSLFTLYGSFDFLFNPTTLSVNMDAELRAFFDLATVAVHGEATIDSGGVLIDVGLDNMSFGVSPIFGIGATGVQFYLNTHSGQEAAYIDMGTVDVDVLFLLTLDGSARVGFIDGDFEVRGALSIDFFSIVTLSADVYFSTSGEFSLSIYGSIWLGSSKTGLGGDISATIAYLADHAAPFDQLGPNDLFASGSINGSAKLFGYTLGSLGATLQYDGATGEITVGASLTVNFVLFSKTFSATFSVGFLKPPPPFYLAGNATDDTNWTYADGYYTLPAWEGGELNLNIGTRGQYRNFAGSLADEFYYITAIGAGTDYGQKLSVSGMGRTQTYDNVTSIVGYAGSGQDHIEIDSNVTVDVTLTGGEGTDRLESYGTGVANLSGNNDHDLLFSGDGAATIHGNAGHDRIDAGGGIDNVYGDANDDTIIWYAGDGSDAVLQGGSGTDYLFIYLPDSDDDVEVLDPGSGQFRISYASGSELLQVDSGFEHLTVDAAQGADDITVRDLSGVGLTSVMIDLGDSSPHDGSADHVVLEGDSGADVFTVSTSSDEVDVTHTGVTTFTIQHANRASGDHLTIDAKGGADSLNAAAVTQDLLLLELMGDAAGDMLIGSQFNDIVNSGLGDDTVTGGVGVDTFVDAGGSDTLVETRNLDMTLTDDTFIVGTIQSNAGGTFGAAAIPGGPDPVTTPLLDRGDRYAAGAEVEDLGGLFETATLTGGSSNNIIVLGDRDGSITVGGAPVATATAWTGAATLDNAGSSDGFVEYYLLNLTGTGGSAVTIDDSSSGDYDDLVIVGTAAAETYRVTDTPSDGEVVVGTPGLSTADVVDHDDVSQVTIDSLGGVDTVNVQSMDVATVLHTGDGADVVNVGSLAPATGGNVNAIDAGLFINGNGGSDTLNVDDTADVAANTGILTSTTLTDLGMAVGITYGTLETVNVDLGEGGDTFTIASTHAGITTVDANDGGDTVNIQTAAGATTVTTGIGNDTVNVGSAAPATGGNVNGINGLLTLVADGGANDVLNVDDTGDAAANTGLLTATRLTGLGMAANNPAKGIDYSGFETINILLGSGNDDFTIDATHAGETNLYVGGGNDTVAIETIAGVTNVFGEAGDDLITVNENLTSPSTANGLAAVLNLDGQGGSDDYIVNAFGNGDSLINVFDTGSTIDGVDLLTVNGTAGDDQFLVRANFVAVLVDIGDDGTFDTAERINYDQNLNEGIVLNGLAGEDHFASDDNSATTTLNGGADNDTFQIGQVFNADRVPPHVASGDEIETTLTTVGYLTNGASLPLTANGGAGEDTFVVFRNLAPLSLNGGADNDNFTVRAFALAATGLMDPEQQETQVDGGAGADLIEYAVNAPVNINGGDGTDIVRVLGTEFADRFAITNEGVYGAGLYVVYVGIEAVEVHGGDGSDEFYVLSTSAAVKTTIFGGAGSDHFYVGENSPVVVANDLRGHTGLLDHDIDATVIGRDPAFDEVSVIGTAVNVADNEASEAILVESGGQTRVSENGLTDSYTIRLSRAPTHNVVVTVSTPVLPPEITDLGGAALLVSTGGGTPATAITLLFTPTNWATPQTVTIHAIDDALAEEFDVLPLMHSVISDDASYHALAIRSIPVEIIDNDTPSVVVTTTGLTTDVLEGDFTDTYTLTLTHAPSAAVTVDLTPDAGLSLSHTSVVLNAGNWNTGVSVTVTAVDDLVVEGPQVLGISHSISTALPGRDVSFDGADIAGVEVNVFDNDSPGVIVTPTDGTTDVLEGGATDTYTVQLTSQPAPGSTVTVLINSLAVPTTTGDPAAVQVSTAPVSLTFDAANWNVAQIVTVSAIDDGVTDDPNAQGFATQLRTLTGIRGPLFIEGAPGEASLFDIKPPVMLPGETDTGTAPIVTGNQSEQENPGDVDRLDIVDVDAVADDTGVLTGQNLSGLGMGGDLVLETSPGVFETVPGGITYAHLEIFELQLGSGSETLDVQSVAANLTTIIRGHAGNDVFNVSAPTATNAMLVIYGDTAASDTHRGIGGNDTIDASAAAFGATYYGGVANDTILGGSGADRIAGGGGEDVLGGNAGDDLILGDSGFDVDRETRVTTIAVTGTPGEDNFDLPGGDTINPGEGEDIVFGDHGVITQDGGTAGVLAETGVVASAETVNDALGGADTISANANAHAAFGGVDVVFGGRDLVFGGAGADAMTGGLAGDVLVGDVGIIRLDLDSDLASVDRVEIDLPGTGAGDTIHGGNGDDVILGGAGGDTILGQLGQDVIVGDSGYIDYVTDDGDAADIDVITTTDPTVGGADDISGGDDNDIILAGTAGDVVSGGAGNDLIFGDHGLVQGDVDAGLLPMATSVKPFSFTAIDTQNTDGGGADAIHGDSGDDIILGQQGGDTIYGDADDDDLIGGHNVAGGHDGGDAIDGGTGQDVIAGDNAVIDRRDDTISARHRLLNGDTLYDDADLPDVQAGYQADAHGMAGRDVTLLDHSDAPAANTSGNDYLAGGADDDLLFGQLGADTVQGDGSIDVAVSATVPSFDAVTDGDDYIEGGGGDDLIFGNLGQDDIVGGSSDWFGLATAADRPDGSDWIFGGSGTDIVRNTLGDLSADGHARDADVILGDNGLICRPVGLGGTLLTFVHDTYGGALSVIPRAVGFLDYTPGVAGPDIGAGDLIHGEAGDDVVYGMTGDDILFGEGQDDDLYGGDANDWMSGGSGIDGMLGDNGMIMTARNSMAAPLFGLAATTEEIITVSGGQFEATLYAVGLLNKSVDLTPFDEGGQDVMYGGLGDDFMHGGADDDAMSGAEALGSFYDAATSRFGIPLNQPIVVPTAIVFDANVGEFTDYHEEDPRPKIIGHALNFEAEDAGTKIEDGNDALFGDLGNDWLVGGTNNDHLFGGLGSDLLNADDNLETAGDTNSEPDVDPFADGDYAYGGGGRDVLIGNAMADRLIDWAGEFNSFIVPFKRFGAPTVNRFVRPHVPEFLYALGKADGADQTLGVDPTRNGEPFGELGLVLQQDKGAVNWSDQTGGPADPQPGNAGGTKSETVKTVKSSAVAETAAIDVNVLAEVDAAALSFSDGGAEASFALLADVMTLTGDDEGVWEGDALELDLQALEPGVVENTAKKAR